MTAPTAIDVEGEPIERIVVRKLKGDEQLEITVVEVVSDVEHEMADDAGLEKEGVEAHLQEALAAAPWALRRGAASGAARVAHGYWAGRSHVPATMTTAGSRSRSSGSAPSTQWSS